jgi:alpha-galactosidase
MYYAFFAPDPLGSWKGQIELRGLQAGKFRARDYVNERDLGVVDSRSRAWM